MSTRASISKATRICLVAVQVVAVLWILGLVALVVNPTGQGASAFVSSMNLPGGRWFLNLGKAAALFAIAAILYRMIKKPAEPQK